jgi:hypothetical protein
VPYAPVYVPPYSPRHSTSGRRRRWEAVFGAVIMQKLPRVAGGRPCGVGRVVLLVAFLVILVVARCPSSAAHSCTLRGLSGLVIVQQLPPVGGGGFGVASGAASGTAPVAAPCSVRLGRSRRPSGVFGVAIVQKLPLVAGGPASRSAGGESSIVGPRAGSWRPLCAVVTARRPVGAALRASLSAVCGASHCWGAVPYR